VVTELELGIGLIRKFVQLEFSFVPVHCPGFPEILREGRLARSRYNPLDYGTECEVVWAWEGRREPTLPSPAGLGRHSAIQWSSCSFEVNQENGWMVSPGNF
jgi:hypothetical protein